MKARGTKRTPEQIVERDEDDLTGESIPKGMTSVRFRRAVRAESDEECMKKKQMAKFTNRMRSHD